MSIEVQNESAAESVKSQIVDNPLLADPALLQGLNDLVTKISPLIQTGRLNNIVDLLSLVSDNIEFLDEAMLEKLTKAGEDLLAVGWTAGNAIRMANARTQRLEGTPTLIQLMRLLNNNDVRRSLYFILEFMQVIGKQMKSD